MFCRVRAYLCYKTDANLVYAGESALLRVMAETVPGRAKLNKVMGCASCGGNFLPLNSEPAPLRPQRGGDVLRQCDLPVHPRRNPALRHPQPPASLGHWHRP